MVRNAAVEAEKNITTIKSSVKPESGSFHPRTFMGVLGGSPSIQIAVLVSIFQYEYNNSMSVETLGGYLLASSEAAYEDPY